MERIMKERFKRFLQIRKSAHQHQASSCLEYSVSEQLLAYYFEKDADVLLIGENYEIPVKLSLIACFVDRMYADICKEHKDHSIRITKFEEKVTEKFVTILKYRRIRNPQINELSWVEVLDLLRFSHFYKCNIAFDNLLDYGKYQINSEKIFDAVSIMDEIGFDGWTQDCIRVLKIDKEITKTSKWLELIQSCPNIVSRLLTKLVNGEHQGFESYISMNEVMTDKLLEYYKNSDEIIRLCGAGFEFSLHLSYINCFIPMMQTSLTTSVGKQTRNTSDRGLQRVVKLRGFQKRTFSLFVQMVQGPYDDLFVGINWKEGVDLLKIAHFYQCDVVLDVLSSTLSFEISKHNIYEAIKLMHLMQTLHEDWKEHCIGVLRDDTKEVLTNPRWKSLVKECPTATAGLLTETLLGVSESLKDAHKRLFGDTEDENKTCAKRAKRN